MRLRRFFSGLRALLHQDRAERDLHDELQAYLESAADHHAASGLSREDALRAARLDMGGVEAVKERVRDAGWETGAESLWQDVRYGWRALRRSPGFTAAAVLTLALGIGANTAIFSLVSWLVLRPLPIAHPEQVTFLAFPQDGSRFDARFSWSEYQEIRRASGRAFEDVGAFSFGGTRRSLPGGNGLTADGTTEPVQTVFVTGNFFSLLGLRPHLGRLLLPSEGARPGADPVVVISDRYWRSRFSADPSIVGRPVAIDGHGLTVVGVAPEGFYGVTPIFDMQTYLPLGMSVVEGPGAADWLGDPKARPLVVVGRLRDGVSIPQAEASLAALGRQIALDHPRERAAPALLVRPLRPPGLMNGPNPLPRLAALFLTLAGLLLLLASINVTNLLLVRAGVRRHEMSVRAALGAGRGRLVRQMLTESLLLASLGCAAGLVVGTACTRVLTSLPLETEFPLVLDVRFDWRVFAYTAVASLLTGLLVGVVPAFRAAGGSLVEMLHERGRGTTAGRQRSRTALVVAQVGGSLALLIAATLFTRSLAAVKTQDFGFDPRGVLNLKVSPRQIGLTEAQGAAFYRELLARLQSLPGVRSASLASSLPLGDDSVEVPVEVPGYDMPEGERPPTSVYTIVSTGYLSTMRMRLLEGRDFSDADRGGSAEVAIVNQEMGDRFWPTQDPIGRTFAVPGPPRQTFQVVGVVNNSRVMDPDGPMSPAFFVPAAQHYTDSANVQVRADGLPGAMLPGIRDLVRSLAPAMPVYGVRTMEQSVNGINGLLLYAVGAALAAAMGLVGLLLAVVGVYGVIAYSVNQRRQEIGIRVALGARPGEILFMIARQGLFMVAAGVAFGLAVALALTRLLGGFLTGVSDTDPVTYVVVSACLGAVAMLAGYIPARRAMKVDPMVALRCE